MINLDPNLTFSCFDCNQLEKLVNLIIKISALIVLYILFSEEKKSKLHTNFWNQNFTKAGLCQKDTLDKDRKKKTVIPI